MSERISDERLKELLTIQGCTGYKNSETMAMAKELLAWRLGDLEELEECQRPIFNQAATLKKLEDELEEK